MKTASKEDEVVEQREIEMRRHSGATRQRGQLGIGVRQRNTTDMMRDGVTADARQRYTAKLSTPSQQADASTRKLQPCV